MAYKSEDIKKLNGIELLKVLYTLDNATMLELVETTHFSQSLVRSLLKTLESKGILLQKTIDQSTGGRCPVRYTFAEDYFQILSVFVDEGTVEICIKDIFHQEKMYRHYICGLNEELETIIINLTKIYPINCISIGSSGVVKDECFFNDHGEYMEKHEIALHLKKVLNIPIIIENDVKCMMMGVQAKQHCEQLAYLYMSQTGIGSAYYIKQDVLRGHHSFSGELGLIPYQNQTINQVIASYPKQAVLEDIYVNLLTTIAVTIDPQKIIIAGKLLQYLSIEKIKQRVQGYLSKRYILDIETSLYPLNDAMEGLHYLGILRLFDIYTDYERIIKNE